MSFLIKSIFYSVNRGVISTSSQYSCKTSRQLSSSRQLTNRAASNILNNLTNGYWKPTGVIKPWCERYTEKHDEWWARQRFENLLQWQPADICKSRHLGLSDQIRKFKGSCQQANSKMCWGIDKLDYQPSCHCGFDGKQVSITKLVSELSSLQQQIERQAEHFFSRIK